ncbi:MAG: hypothetical protein K2Q20_09545, partial [Phycisphaerales bacterium]|nr:hypothetical protein [Phycisphaerales bacterium]
MPPATLWDMFAVGVDIGGTSVKVALIDVSGVGRDAWPRAMRTHTGRSAPYDTPDAPGIGAAITQAARAAAHAATREASSALVSAQLVVAAVGVCAPGLIDEQTGVIAASMNLPMLVGVELRALVLSALASANISTSTRTEASASGGGQRDGGEFALPRVAFLPDAHAAALDFWNGLSEGMAGTTGAAGTAVQRGAAGTASPMREPPERLLALSLGTGVGACVIDREARSTPDGTTRWAPRRVLVTGVSSGHLGQIDVGFDEPDPGDPSGRRLLARPVGSDGGIGSLESYIGLGALRERCGNDLAQ